MSTASELCDFVRQRFAQGLSLDAALLELELLGVSDEVVSDIRGVLRFKDKKNRYGDSGKTFDGGGDWRYLAYVEFKSHLDFVRLRMTQGATPTQAAIDLRKKGVGKRIACVVYRWVTRTSSATVDDLTSVSSAIAYDERAAQRAAKSRLLALIKRAEAGAYDERAARAAQATGEAQAAGFGDTFGSYVGIAVLLLGGVLLFGNLSELLPTFPFSGLLVIVFGAYLASGGTKK